MPNPPVLGAGGNRLRVKLSSDEQLSKTLLTFANGKAVVFSDLLSVNDLMSIVGETHRYVLDWLTIINGNLKELTDVHRLQADFCLYIVERASDTFEIEAIGDFLNRFRLLNDCRLPCGSRSAGLALTRFLFLPA